MSRRQSVQTLRDASRVTSDFEWHDVIGVGFGPANIALAVAAEELLGADAPDMLFLEARSNAVWQENMLLPDSDVQNHPLRDLVTPRNPRSRYSFTNFLFEHGRLYEHLNMGLALPMREEYALYVAWVASHFGHQVRYGESARSLEVVFDAQGRGVGYELRTESGRRYRARAVVVAPGRTPLVPSLLEPLLSERVFHLKDYLPAIARVASPGMRVAVVGGSQSAVEIMLHLSSQYPDAEVLGVCRSFGYKSKDLGPFTGEVYFPAFVQRFYAASPEGKRRLRNDLHLTNYSSADLDVLEALYRRMYHQKLRGTPKLGYLRCADITSARREGEQIVLDVSHYDVDEPMSLGFDVVIAATGFKDLGALPHQERCPRLLEQVYPHTTAAPGEVLPVGLDYALTLASYMASDAKCFLNGLCESTHGMGDAGSFSLLALRSEVILRSLFDGHRERRSHEPHAAALGAE